MHQLYMRIRYLCVMELQKSLIVMGVIVHSLVDHSYVSIHLLTPFLQRPVLSTFSPAALLSPVHKNVLIFVFILLYLDIGPRYNTSLLAG